MSTSASKSRHQRSLRSKAETVEYFKSHQRVRTKELQIQRAQTLSWNCDGTRLAVGANDKKIAVLHVDNSSRLTSDFTSSSHEAPINQVAFQHDSPFVFASASEDKSICLWDVRHPKKHTRITTKVTALFITWSTCGRYIIYLTKDNKIHVVDNRTLGIISCYELDRTGNEIKCHPDGKHLFVCSGGGKVEILSVPSLEHVQTLQVHSIQTAITAIGLSNDGSKMAVGGSDALVSMWDLHSMGCERTMPRMDYPVRAISFSAEGNLLATSSEDPYIDVAWTADCSRVCDVPLDADCYSMAWHPKNLILAYTSSSDSRGRGFDIGLFGLSS